MCEIFLLDPADIGLTNPGDDAADFIARLGDVTADAKMDAIDVALASARAVNVTADLADRIEATANGRYAAIEVPGWPTLHKLAQPFLPGTLTALAGDPGDGKSFLALQVMLDLHLAGVPVAIFQLEEDRPYWLTRTLAILGRQCDLTRPEWVRANADNARSIYRQHRDTLNRFAPHLEVAGDRQVKHADLVAWVKARAAAGCRVIGIDPVTALTPSREPWIADLELVTELKTIARRYGCSLLLVTHPRIGRRGSRGPTLDDIAGGAAWVRFTQTVLWVRRHEPPKECTWVSRFSGKGKGRMNRSIKISKSRNGPGGGMEIAANFVGDILRFTEHGPIVENE